MGNNKSRSRLQIKMPRLRAHNNDRKTKGIKNDSKKGRERWNKLINEKWAYSTTNLEWNNGERFKSVKKFHSVIKSSLKNKVGRPTISGWPPFKRVGRKYSVF